MELGSSSEKKVIVTRLRKKWDQRQALEIISGLLSEENVLTRVD